MTDAEQREAARQFANKWKGRGREDEDGRSYWIDFLSNVLGMENVTDRVEFEKKVVVDGNTKRIDVYIPETHVLIEQKSLGKALDHKIMNSGSIELTPYDQAKRYNDNLPYDEKARWIITSNFSDIWIYDMNARVPEAVKISLDEIPSKYPLLDILIKKDVQKISHEMEVSIKAGDIVGLLYEAFLTQYKIPEVKAKEETIEQKEKREHKLKSLNALCVRIVFCLYAEDAGIFGKRNIFHDYLKAYEVKDCRRALLELFKVLDTPVSERDEYLEEDLAQFPYVNGGLFSDETIEIPPLTEEIKELLLTKASEDFDWSDISPTIFGAVFESTLNPETRRSSGMHYTSISNIHKVIDPLFLDKLQTEFHEILKISVVHPELIVEWSKKNLPLTPDGITFGSNKVVWWKGSCGHEWQTSVKARSKGEKCPICSGVRAVAGINDLSTLKPGLASEWSKKNEIKPTEVTVGSHKKVIWKCRLGHEWTASVKSRSINGSGCPYCSHNKVLVGFNDLATVVPKVADEWSEKNEKKPTEVTAFANRKAWWKCRDCDYEWNTLISTRSGGSKCPCCSGYTFIKGRNDLKTTHPEITEEWSEKNYPLQPDEVNAKSRKMCGGIVRNVAMNGSQSSMYE